MKNERDQIENAMLEKFKAWGFELSHGGVTVSAANAHFAREHLALKGLGHVKVSVRRPEGFMDQLPYANETLLALTCPRCAKPTQAFGLCAECQKGEVQP